MPVVFEVLAASRIPHHIPIQIVAGHTAAAAEIVAAEAVGMDPVAAAAVDPSPPPSSPWPLLLPQLLLLP